MNHQQGEQQSTGVPNFPTVRATVFINNISEKVTEPIMRDILNKCGNVLSWQRVQKHDGQLSSFGFCEYDNPEATLRCLRILDQLQIADKRLGVKVDEKVQELLNEYIVKKQKAIEQREAEKDDQTKKEWVKAKEEKEDKNILQQIRSLIKNCGTDAIEDKENSNSENREEINLDKSTNDRNKTKKENVDKRKERIRENSENESNDRYKTRYPNVDRYEKSTIESSDVYRPRTSWQSKHKSSREIKPQSFTSGKDSRHSRSSKFSRYDRHDDDHQYSRSPKSSWHEEQCKNNDYRNNYSKHNRNEERYRFEEDRFSESSKVSIQDEEQDKYNDAVEKKLEKKLRHKDVSYQKRLKSWETREKIKQAQYKMSEERKAEKDREITNEALKLQLFLEYYDDEILDKIYYSGSELDRRLVVREGEIQMDELDRVKEFEVIEETRQQLIKEEAQNFEEIIIEMERKAREHLQKRLPIERINQKEKMELTEANVFDASEATSYEDQAESAICQTTPKDETNSNIKDDAQPIPYLLPNEHNESPTQLQLKYTKEQQSDLQRQIVESIPNSKTELFAYPIEWDLVDENCINAKVRPWIERKFKDYIGEQEPELSNFICVQLLHHKSPEEIFTDLYEIIDDEANIFVMKLWRLLIYVIHAKKYGIE